mgnify:CR=1 FL=1
MQTNYYNLYRIKQVIDYIEDNLKEPISLEDVSNATGISAFYLHRIFKSLTGYPLVYYIRSRKLSKSIGELLKTDMTILDIAQEYGFEYQQSYSRAFKKHFNISPDNFRQDYGATVLLTNKHNLRELTDMGGGLLHPPKYIVKTEFCIVGERSLVSDSDNLENATANKLGTDFFFTKAPLVPNAVACSVYYGYVRETPDREQSWYQPSVEVSDLSCVPDGMHGLRIPARCYAVFTYTGHHAPERITYQVLKDLYKAIFAVWMAGSGEKKADCYHFERVDTSLCSQNYCEMDIYIPIKWPND